MPCPPSLHTRLRSTLRALWLRSPERYAAIKAARVSRGLYLCASCKGAFGVKGIAVDHIEPCGRLTSLQDASAFLERLFHGRLQVLCRDCHAAKTKMERAHRL